MASNKELEKEMKAVMAELMAFTTKRMATMESALKEYIDKQIKKQGGDTQEYAKQLMGFTKTTVSATEKSLVSYIEKSIATLKRANNLK